MTIILIICRSSMGYYFSDPECDEHLLFRRSQNVDSSNKHARVKRIDKIFKD